MIGAERSQWRNQTGRLEHFFEKRAWNSRKILKDDARTVLINNKSKGELWSAVDAASACFPRPRESNRHFESASKIFPSLVSFSELVSRLIYSSTCGFASSWDWVSHLVNSFADQSKSSPHSLHHQIHTFQSTHVPMTISRRNRFKFWTLTCNEGRSGLLCSQMQMVRPEGIKTKRQNPEQHQSIHQS